jgi:5-hydroxyisourate hydrolase
MKGNLSTHVLDIGLGRPGAGIPVKLWRIDGETRELVKSTITNLDGRTNPPLLGPDDMVAGDYELVFDVGGYFERTGKETFLESIPVRFRIAQPDESYHVPLLVAPWGYSTYRGS